MECIAADSGEVICVSEQSDKGCESADAATYNHESTTRE